jgi:ABC-type multidrug transport system fused ATPase/permease subunit
MRQMQHGKANERVCSTDIEEIAASPDGLETRIKSSGCGFSGSQRQQIGPDRALVRCPDIVILNEALHAVGPRLEVRIQARIL